MSRTISTPLQRLALPFLLLCLAALELAAPTRAATDPVTRRVAVVNYDPVHPQTGRRLSDRLGWYDIEAPSRDFAELILKTSGGYLNYQLEEFITLDHFPVKLDVQQYTWDSYLRCRADTNLCIDPDAAGYEALMSANTDLAERIAAGRIDEVWV